MNEGVKFRGFYGEEVLIEVESCPMPEHDHLEITINGEKKFYFHICSRGMTTYPNRPGEPLAYIIGAGQDNADYKITDEVKVGLVKDQREGGDNAIQ